MGWLISLIDGGGQVTGGEGEIQKGLKSATTAPVVHAHLWVPFNGGLQKHKNTHVRVTAEPFRNHASPAASSDNSFIWPQNPSGCSINIDQVQLCNKPLSLGREEMSGKPAQPLLLCALSQRDAFIHSKTSVLYLTRCWVSSRRRQVSV